MKNLLPELGSIGVFKSMESENILSQRDAWRVDGRRKEKARKKGLEDP
jgi:hypothetical protein